MAKDDHDQPQSFKTDALDEHRLRRLLGVSRALTSQLELEVVLRQAMEVAGELTGARYVALGVLDDKREELERFLTLGIEDEAHEAIGELPRGHGVLGELIRRPQALRVHDVTQHPHSYGFPPAHPPMTSFLGVPIMIRGEAYGNLYLTDKAGGGEFDEADEQSVMFLADCTAIAIDNARLYKAVWDRREELETVVRVLRATNEIARALGGEIQLERVLELIVKRGRALVDARVVMILLEEGDELVVTAAAGEIDSGALGQRIPIASSSSQALLSGRVERLADVASSIRISPGELEVSATSALVVPLTFRGARLGVLAAFDRTVAGPEFRSVDEELLKSFAGSAAIAVATARSVAEERLRHSLDASEQERRRWARELHDETLQGLGALQVVLSSALRRGSPEGLAAAVRDAVDQLGIEIGSLRNLITELRPAALDEIGLAPAIESLVERTATSEGFIADVNLELMAKPDGKRLAPDLESTIYRLVQESLTNVVKHAQAKRIRVSVVESSDTVDVTVSDDGVGFDAGGSFPGFGLRGMRERVTLADGRLELSSAPGEGTTVRVCLPVSHPAQAGGYRASA